MNKILIGSPVNIRLDVRYVDVPFSDLGWPFHNTPTLKLYKPDGTLVDIPVKVTSICPVDDLHMSFINLSSSHTNQLGVYDLLVTHPNYDTHIIRLFETLPASKISEADHYNCPDKHDSCADVLVNSFAFLVKLGGVLDTNQ